MFSYGFPEHWSTLRKLLWLKLLQGAAAVVETVTGNLPLTLSNAIEHAILSLTRYGLCTQDGTPTPDAPVDIMCNNGVIKCSPNLFDASAGNVTLGYYIEKTTGTIRRAQGDSNFMCEAYMPVIGGQKYVAYGRTKNGGVLSAYNRIAWYDSNKDWISGGDYTQNTVTVNTAPANAAYARFSCNPSGNTITAVTQELVDSYYWVFQQGDSEPSVVHGYKEIYIEGTPEVLTVSGINLLDPSAVTNKKYISANGQELPSQSPTGWLNHSDYIAVTAGEDYTLSVTGADGGSNTIAFNWFDANKTILATRPTKNVTSGTAEYTFTNTAPADAAYLIVNFITGTKAMVEKGSTASSYEPYVTPQTASVPMLLSVGNYKDEVELIHGIKTGKVGVKVFDGTEDWLYSSSWSDTTHKCFYVELDTIKQQTTVTNECLCSHLEWYSRDSFYADKTIVGGCVSGYIPTDPESGRALTVRVSSSIAETANDLKAWLADQYAAGTPVIVVYPLATETTEQTTAQHLATHQGTNIVDSTANVGPVEAKVEYMKVA